MSAGISYTRLNDELLESVMSRPLISDQSSKIARHLEAMMVQMSWLENEKFQVTTPLMTGPANVH